jgi:predicted transcriptional regulator
MSAPARRAAVEHDARLSILCCLLGNREPLALSQVSAQTGLSPIQVKYHVRILDVFCLVEKRRAGDSGKARYAAQLDEQPNWVRAPIQGHCPKQGGGNGD